MLSPNQQENDLVMHEVRSGSLLNDQHKQTKQKMQHVESNYLLDVIKAKNKLKKIEKSVFLFPKMLFTHFLATIGSGHQDSSCCQGSWSK